MYRTRIIIMILIVGGAAAGLSSLARPAVLPASAPETSFSAERAMEHISAVALAPHPPGSLEIERVRQYIVGELEALGLEPEILEAQVLARDGSAYVASSIENIVAELPGSDSSKAILLDAHYDTRAMTPGASDCGSCVATVLETARALLAGPQLKNDVVLLFSDNEEYGGGLGATALLERHIGSGEIGAVLNHEGLGSTGPSLLFETGPDSGWLVREWRKTVSHPVGQSWFAEIYVQTPISTDLNAFSDAGVPGMNFGFWAEGTVYHTALDTPTRIDPRSVQHHGSYTLALTKELGNMDLTSKSESTGGAVYFSVFPGVLVSYARTWALPLAGLAGLLLVVALVQGVRSGKLSIKGSLKGAGAHLLGVLLSTGLATGIWMGISQLHGEYQAMFTFRGLVYNATYYVLALSVLAVAIAAVIVVWTRRKTSVLDLTTGTLLFWWVLALATAILFPGVSYLFTWPVVFISLALGWVVIRKKPGSSAIALTIGALPAIILLSPTVYVVYHFVLSPMIGVPVFFVALLLGLLTPALDNLTKSRPRWMIIGSLVVFAILLIIGSLTAGFTPDRPRPNAIAYSLDADTGQAVWISAGSQQDEWTRRFFADDPERAALGGLFPIARPSTFPVMHGAAPGVSLPAPGTEITGDQIVDGVRKISMRLFSEREAPVIELDIAPYEAVEAVTIAGKRLESIASERDLWTMIYYALPPEGIELLLEVTPDQALTIQLIDSTWDLVPEVLAAVDASDRPAGMMRTPNFDYGTIVVSQFEIP